jgi:hypothetical protein
MSLIQVELMFYDRKAYPSSVIIDVKEEMLKNDKTKR